MRRIVLFTFALLAVACGGGGPTNPGGGGGATNFTAKIDGVAWAPDIAPAVTAQNPTPGFYSITALKSTGSNNYSIGLQLYNITGTGTYPLGVGLQMFGGSGIVSQPPGSGWSTPLTGVDGQIQITTLTATRMVGTFDFVATPLSGSAVNKTVTEGQFDLLVAGTGGVAAANQGSSFSGSIGGTETFVGSAGTALVTSGNLLILVNNGTRTVTLSVANFAGANTYTLGASPARSVQVGGSPTNALAAWTSNTTGGSGSIVVLTSNTGRIGGSFNATVVGIGGTAGSLTVSGSFSMGGTF